MKVVESGTLHPDLRGGDHYLATPATWGSRSDTFMVIFQKENKLIFAKSLTKIVEMSGYATDRSVRSLNEDCKDGIYYWCTCGGEDNHSFYYVALQSDEWGFQVRKKTHLEFGWSDCGGQFPLSAFPINMTSFVPGGIYYTMGPTTGRWTLVKSRDNTSKGILHWSQEITYKVGQNKGTTKSVEKDWEVSSTAEAGFSGSLFSAHLSVTGSYGEKRIDASKEDWSDERQTKETVSIDIKPGEAVYIWQFKFVVGDDDVLLSKYLKYTAEDKAPTEVPADLLRIN